MSKSRAHALILSGISLLAIGVAAGVAVERLYLTSRGNGGVMVAGGETDEPKILYWVAAMDPK